MNFEMLNADTKVPICNDMTALECTPLSSQKSYILNSNPDTIT